MVDMWEQEAGVSRPASSHNNSQQCSQSNQMAKCAPRHTLEPLSDSRTVCLHEPAHVVNTQQIILTD